MSGIPQTTSYYDNRWSQTIKQLPRGGDYRLDLRSNGWKIIADYIGENKKTFDFACGLGFVNEMLKNNGCQVHGCDFSGIAVEWTKNKTGGDFRKEGEIFGDGYDYIIAPQFIEHIEDPVDWINKALDKSKAVICSIPNNFSRHGDHYLMQWGSWDEFYSLFSSFDIERIDKPELYATTPKAWKHPTFVFRRTK